jgi:predicted DNA-binding protein (MmcQ/YjbR family)
MNRCARHLEGGRPAIIIHSMRPAALRAHCLSFPGSVETFPFGPETSVFKVAGKMFALSQLAQHPLRVSLKCEPPLAEQLREAHAAVLPGYHLNKRHWNTVIIDGSLPERMIKEMIEDSFDLVVSQLPVSRRRALGWPADAPPAQAQRGPR